jgi:serine/threonine-protein kinase
MVPTRDQFPPLSDTQMVSGPTLAASSPGTVDLSATLLEEQGFAKRYELDQLLGQGGMGEVHLCRDARIGRRVALKRLRAQGGSGSTPQARVRFLREARIQGQLEHPAVVPVYDLGRTPDGAEFFTMKRIRGRTLADILADGQTTRRKLLQAFSSVCLAVDYAHTRGVLHRDLKPANLMLGDFGEVYVLDWGLAKIASDPEDQGEKVELGDSSGQTIAGAILGTPGYAPPEVMAGKPAGAQSDVYALGAILFELLTGERLHGGTSVGELIRSTMTGAEARASVRAPRSEVPPELEQLCVRATALEASARPQTPRELSEAVERFLDGDRDLELRREHARQHAESAAQAAERALAAGAPLAERQRALSEVGRALAFDPENRDAARTLVQLLTTPPADVPPEAQHEIERAEHQQMRSDARLGVFVYLVSIALVPMVPVIGVRSWTALVIATLLFAAAAMTSFVISRLERPGGAALLAVLLLSTAAIGSISYLFGAYMLLPAVLAVNTMGFALHERAVPAPVILIIGCLGVIVPAALDWLHLWPPAYHFGDGVIEVFARGMAFHGRGPEVALFVGSIATVLGSSIFAVHAARARVLAEQRLQLHAWQLRQLVADRSH